MFFALRVNNAIARLGVDPRVFKEEYRQAGQLTGKSLGSTPQETALIMVSNLPLAFRMQADPIIAKGWIRSRKINPRDRAVRDALFQMSWDELADF